MKKKMKIINKNKRKKCKKKPTFRKYLIFVHQNDSEGD